MSVEIGLPLKFLSAWRIITNHGCTWMRVFAFGIVGFHVRLPVVASLEELPTDTTFMRSFLWRSALPLFLYASDTGQHWRMIKRCTATILSIVKLCWVSRCSGPRPFAGRSAVQILSGSIDRRHSMGIRSEALRRQRPLKNLLISGRWVPFACFLDLDLGCTHHVLVAMVGSFGWRI